MNRIIGVLFIVFAAVMVSYAFSGRSTPSMPASAVSMEMLQMLDAVRTPGGQIVAVGERGHVFRSSDGGREWHRMSTPGTPTLTAVTALPGAVVAVGHDATVWLSEDEGGSWREVFAAPEDEAPLLDVLLDADGRGWAVGAYGLLLETRDGGRHWAATEIPANEEGMHLNAIARLDAQRLLIAGEAGLLLRSDDDGASWQRLDSPYQGSFFGVQRMRDGAVLVFGMRGHVFRSEDGGEHWQALASEAQSSLFGAGLLDDGRVLLTGQGGQGVLVAQDGMTATALPGPDRLVRAAVLQVAEDEVLLFGEEGVVRMPLPSAGAGRS